MIGLENYLVVPTIRWIGVLPSDIKKLSLPTIPFTKNDTIKLNSLFKRPHINNLIYDELLLLNKLRVKSEIEGIDISSDTNSFLINFIKNKIDRNEGI